MVGTCFFKATWRGDEPLKTMLAIWDAGNHFDGYVSHRILFQLIKSGDRSMSCIGGGYTSGFSSGIDWPCSNSDTLGIVDNVWMLKILT